MSIEEQYNRLTSATEAHSLLKKYLTADVFNELKNKKTKYGGTLSQCINSGVEQLDVEIGVRATDPDAYETFGALFKPVIKDYHKIPFDSEIQHPPSYFGDMENLKLLSDLDPDKQYIRSTRVRVGRNLEGYPLQSLLSVEQRAAVEAKIVSVFDSLENEYKGEYFSLETMPEEQEKYLIDNHFLFNHSNSASRSAGVYRDWPKNRGIYMNKANTFLAWISETDHTRIISMQKDGRLDEVYRRLVKAVHIFERKLNFAHSDSLGYITFCPTNLGTTLRASVHIKIPKLASDKQLLHEQCEKYHLQVRGLHGDGSDVYGDVFDISNKRRLGLTEWQLVSEMQAGVRAVIELEKSL